jgi:cell fate regulator YaaT (PSP1 superfamily)
MGVPKLCYARDLDLRVGYKVIVKTTEGAFIGRVALTPRRREPYMRPYEILRVATPEDEREEDEHRELGREIRAEAQKLARDHLIKGVKFIGCDVSLDGSFVEVKYGAENRPNLGPVRDGLERAYSATVVLRHFTFIERASDTSGCDTCGVPLCCATWSRARSMGPVNIRLAKQQGINPSDKIIGCCGEVKCCMRYEHDTYKEFKERAPFKNTAVTFDGKKGSVVDYSMVKDSVLVQFGSKKGDRELVPLGRLAPENPGIIPADPEGWFVEGPRSPESSTPPAT